MTDMPEEIWAWPARLAYEEVGQWASTRYPTEAKKFIRADVVEARIAEAVAKEREAIAAMIEGSVYTNNGDKRSLQPVRPPFVAGSDTHHATIAAAIRSRT